MGYSSGEIRRVLVGVRFTERRGHRCTRGRSHPAVSHFNLACGIGELAVSSRWHPEQGQAPGSSGLLSDNTARSLSCAPTSPFGPEKGGHRLEGEATGPVRTRHGGPAVILAVDTSVSRVLSIRGRPGRRRVLKRLEWMLANQGTPPRSGSSVARHVVHPVSAPGGWLGWRNCDPLSAPTPCLARG